MFCIPLMNKVITVLEIASFACDYVYSVFSIYMCGGRNSLTAALSFSVDTGAVNWLHELLSATIHLNNRLYCQLNEGLTFLLRSFCSLALQAPQHQCIQAVRHRQATTGPKKESVNRWFQQSKIQNKEPIPSVTFKK